MSKHLAKLLGALVVAIAAMALAAPLAAAKTPAPGYEGFAGCPSKEEKSTISSCFRAEITGGHFQMGSKDVPITNPMVLSGGTNSSGGEFSYNSKGGLTPVKQKVPGGLIGLTGLTWLLEFLGSEALTLYAVTELAGQVGNPLSPVLALPIKVHLINAALGNNCYVGSNSNPINLQLTYLTTSPPPPNKPISGIPPTPFADPATGILHLQNFEQVDNSFAAPGASGCKLYLFGLIPIGIDGIVNAQSGLPAAAGTNETRQKASAEAVSVKKVYPPAG